MCQDKQVAKKQVSTFREAVITVVKTIPEGQVATYGQIAALVGHPGAARQVGMILRGLQEHEDVPWQRVINAKGGVSTYKVGFGELQRALLEAEGITFEGDFCDLSRYQWQPDQGQLEDTSQEGG
jgi:methylated-DNA-protein-cysteine methyltransferase related protein